MTVSPSPFSHLILRTAGPDDQAALRRLAALDSRRPPQGHVLVAEADGEIHAAIAAEDGHTVADPFRPTADMVLLLRGRAQALGWMG